MEYSCRACFSKNVTNEWHEQREQILTRCLDCRKATWQPKNEGYKRPASHKQLAQKFSKGFCEICRRKKENIPPPQTLEAHHVIPFKDGGSSERDNIIICCTSCHKLIHHQIIYLNHYTTELE